MGTTFELAAGKVAVEETDGTFVVGFADSDSDTKHYLMLQRSLADDDQDARLGMNTYYVEVGNQSCSSYGGIERFKLFRHHACLRFGQMSQGLSGLESANIRFEIADRDFERLHVQLTKIFSGTSVYERIDV